MIKWISFNWLTRSFVNWALLTTLVLPLTTLHLVLIAPTLKTNTVPGRITLPLSLFQVFSLTVLSAGVVVVLSSSSFLPLLYFFPSFLPNNTGVWLSFTHLSGFSVDTTFPGKLFLPTKAGLVSFLYRFLCLPYYCVPYYCVPQSLA